MIADYRASLLSHNRTKFRAKTRSLNTYDLRVTMRGRAGSTQMKLVATGTTLSI